MNAGVGGGSSMNDDTVVVGDSTEGQGLPAPDEQADDVGMRQIRGKSVDPGTGAAAAMGTTQPPPLEALGNMVVGVPKVGSGAGGNNVLVDADNKATQTDPPAPPVPVQVVKKVMNPEDDLHDAMTRWSEILKFMLAPNCTSGFYLANLDRRRRELKDIEERWDLEITFRNYVQEKKKLLFLNYQWLDTHWLTKNERDMKKWHEERERTLKEVVALELKKRQLTMGPDVLIA
jgi:hypothetical protein